MNWDVIEGKWKEMKGSVLERWGDLTNDELDQINGSKERLEGVLQQKYGITKDQAQVQIDEWVTGHKEMKKGA